MQPEPSAKLCCHSKCTEIWWFSDIGSCVVGFLQSSPSWLELRPLQSSIQSVMQLYLYFDALLVAMSEGAWYPLLMSRTPIIKEILFQNVVLDEDARGGKRAYRILRGLQETQKQCCIQPSFVMNSKMYGICVLLASFPCSYMVTVSAGSFFMSFLSSCMVSACLWNPYCPPASNPGPSNLGGVDGDHLLSQLSRTGDYGWCQQFQHHISMVTPKIWWLYLSNDYIQ